MKIFHNYLCRRVKGGGMEIKMKLILHDLLPIQAEAIGLDQLTEAGDIIVKMQYAKALVIGAPLYVDGYM